MGITTDYSTMSTGEASCLASPTQGIPIPSRHRLLRWAGVPSNIKIFFTTMRWKTPQPPPLLRKTPQPPPLLRKTPQSPPRLGRTRTPGKWTPTRHRYRKTLKASIVIDLLKTRYRLCNDKLRPLFDNRVHHRRSHDLIGRRQNDNRPVTHETKQWRARIIAYQDKRKLWPIIYHSYLSPNTQTRSAVGASKSKTSRSMQRRHYI